MKKNHTKSIFNKPIFWVFIGFSIGFLIIIPVGIYTFLTPEMSVNYEPVETENIKTIEEPETIRDYNYNYEYLQRGGDEYTPQRGGDEYIPQSSGSSDGYNPQQK